MKKTPPNMQGQALDDRYIEGRKLEDKGNKKAAHEEYLEAVIRDPEKQEYKDAFERTK